jgi:hypothetical protein
MRARALSITVASAVAVLSAAAAPAWAQDGIDAKGGNGTKGAAAAASPQTQATPATTEPIGGEHRILNGHRFIAPGLLDSAILNTSLGFTQGVGVFQFEGVDAFSGEPKDAQLFLYNQGLFGTIGIVNRVAIDVRASGLAAVGGDLNDILVVGALANATAGALAKVRVLTLDDVGFQLSAGGGFYYNRMVLLAPAQILGAASEEDLEDVASSIVQQRQYGSVRPALMAAEGLGPLGIQASVGASIPVVGDPSSVTVDGGLGLTLDLLPLTRAVAVAFTAEYLATQDLGNDEIEAQLSHSFVGGLYYSGRQAFEPGVAVLFAPQSDTQRLIVGQMVLHYYF